MSSTPVLTKKQQKSSLSAKKTKTKETIRNVLASPYSKYWPVISNNHYQTIKNVLNQCLPKLLPDKVKISWKELKKVPKSERKKFSEQYISALLGDNYPGKNIDERNGLILGINDVTKALENGTAQYVLITEDVLPRFMVEHVIDQAVLLGRPVLVVPELRTILKEKCGIASITVAFTDNPRYKFVLESIKDISREYPIPENHINFKRAQRLADDSVILIEHSIIEDTSTTYLSDTIITIEDETSENTKMLEANITKGNVEPDKDLHLIRHTKDKRVFIPDKSSMKPKMDVDNSGFMSFSVNTDIPKVKKKQKKEYITLKVLRITGNAHRNKRKIQAMKDRFKKPKGSKKLKKDDTGLVNV